MRGVVWKVGRDLVWKLKLRSLVPEQGIKENYLQGQITNGWQLTMGLRAQRREGKDDLSSLDSQPLARRWSIPSLWLTHFQKLWISWKFLLNF